MPEALWDGSALVKRYYTEIGSQTVDAVFAAMSAAEMAATFLGYAECAAILRRKLNSRVLDQAAFSSARFLLRQEILNRHDFRLMSIDDRAMLDGIGWIDTYSLNSADAAILDVYLRHARASGGVCVLIAADGRLLKAAAAEGLETLNPELMPAADVAAFLASL
jgi:predicted nucleic acid-binding protein